MPDHPAATRPPPAPDERPPARPVTRRSDRVSLGEKLALGSGYLALFYGNSGVKSLVIPLYQMVLRVNPVVLGFVLAIPRFWDAFTDPVVGLVSDNWHTRFGRRRPLIFVGALLQAVAFGLIWMVPRGLSQTQIITYLLATLLLFYTCYSLYSVPLISLTYEMTPDYQERTRVASFGGLFHKLGELTYSWTFWLANLSVFGGMLAGVHFVGWFISLFVMGLVGVLPALFVRERYYQRAVQQQPVRLPDAFRAAFSNRAFTILLGLTLCQVLAGMISSNIDYYLLVYNMCGGDVVRGTFWKGILSSAYAVVGILSIGPINWLANRHGKRTALFVVFALGLVGAASKWFAFTPGHLWKILIDPLLCGPIWTAIAVLTPSMLADVCDDDEWQHGLRREGLMGSLFSWVQKSGTALSFFGAGFALNVTGFDAGLGGGQAPRTILGMRILLATSAACWSLAGMWLLGRYPLTQEQVYHLRDALEARRGAV